MTNARDRIYGAAGQEPDYQVSSPIFNTNSLKGIELASTSQYYHSLTMVNKDNHEMSMTNFGSCFVTSSADIILSGLGTTVPKGVVATDWQPTTFSKGWSRGGVVSLALPNVKSKVQLVMVVITHGHYEVTMSAIVGSFSKSRDTCLNGLVNTLLSRTENSTSTSA